MGIRESLLNTITSVGSSDFVRIVTSAGASSKATLANVMKSFETALGAKSSLTTSDYIRVVGSDNVSYKQPMIDLMITTGIARNWIATGVDLNTLTPNDTSGNGYYRGNDISTMTNRPSAEINAFPWALNAINVNSYIKQILHVYTAQANIVVYERIQRYSSGSTIWGNWEKMPTRAEIDALNSKIRDSIIRQYRTGEKSKINITANGVSSVDGILTRYDGANLSVYAFHAYTPNGSSFSEAVGVDVKTGQAWSELSTSGGNLVLAVGQYKAGLLTLSYTSGREPTIAYA